MCVRIDNVCVSTKIGLCVCVLTKTGLCVCVSTKTGLCVCVLDENRGPWDIAHWYVYTCILCDYVCMYE